MRLASWAGVPALGLAFATGYAANEAVHRHVSPASPTVMTPAGEELCNAPPAPLLPPLPVEEIDLTCRSSAFGPESTEPPLALQGGGSVRTVSFELPAGAPDGPEPPLAPATMPYLTDDGEPGRLPPLGDVAPLNAVPDAEHPVFKAVQKFLQAGGTLQLEPAAAGPTDRRPEASADVTDKVPLGRPPVSVHPSTVSPNKP